jgi:hypothetical protein
MATVKPQMVFGKLANIRESAQGTIALINLKVLFIEVFLTGVTEFKPCL